MNNNLLYADYQAYIRGSDANCTRYSYEGRTARGNYVFSQKYGMWYHENGNGVAGVWEHINSSAMFGIDGCIPFKPIEIKMDGAHH
jgi:hypothetical protein